MANLYLGSPVEQCHGVYDFCFISLFFSVFFIQSFILFHQQFHPQKASKIPCPSKSY